MNITQEDRIKLNFLAGGAGEEALAYLAKRLFEYHANEVVNASGDEILRHQGAARLADRLKLFSVGLRDASS